MDFPKMVGKEENARLSASNDRSLARVVRDALRVSSGRRDAWAHLALAVVCSVSTIKVDAAELPVPCGGGTCSGADFIRSGNASVTVGGNTLNVIQTTETARLNWAQFNISADGTVNFQQPSASSTAINHIHQNDPSRIFGSLNANGRVYLLNRNGVLFGKDAKVNVAGMVASSLHITEEAVEKGIAGVGGAAPAFDAYTDEQGGVLTSGDVRIEHGATITTTDGGQVLMFAPNIVNEGSISTPGGQTLLAAGSPVYLATSSDPDLRGLLVEVGTGGTVTNGNAETNNAVTNGRIKDPAEFVGQIIAERGNVTLAGLAVNQEGRVSATTTVREAGSIRLQARDGGSRSAQGALTARTGGTLTLAQRSVTEVTLSTDRNDTTVDANLQPKSRIQLQGREVLALENSRVTATGGKIAVTARAIPGDSSPFITTPAVSGTRNDGSRIYLANGATFDVSGASVELAMERNVVRAELRGNELADSPIQRDSPLRGQAVFVDLRQTGTRADGSTWVGTPIGDVSGQVSVVARDAAERNLNGGSVELASQGDVVLAGGSNIDLSGGSVRYRDGFITTTQLLGSDGKIYDIGSADPNRVFVGTTSTYEVKHPRWDVTEKFRTFGSTGRYEAGYVEGKDAGELHVLTPRAILDGAITADVIVGPHQRKTSTELAKGQIHRPYDQLPLGAKFILGRERETSSQDRVTSTVLFDPGLVLPGLRNANGGAFDPEHDQLPVEFTTTRLRPELFGEGRIARAVIHSNDRVDVPQDVSLQLPGQGALSIDAGQIRFDGQVSAPGGTIELSASRTETLFSGISFDVGSTAAFDVSGKWVNDSWRFDDPAVPLAPLLVDGGSVTMSADEASLNLAAGSSINVSSGAWMDRDGELVGGNGGSIDLSVSRDPLTTPPVSLDLGASLIAFGVEHGGKLKLTAPEICVTAVGDCTGNDFEGLLTVRPEDLLTDGFGELSFASNERGLRVAAGAHIDLRQQNYLLGDAARYAASGTSMDQIATRTTLPDHLRAATDLTLRTAIPDLANDLYNNANFASAGGLAVEAGAVIRGDAASTISLSSNSRLVVDGTIEAPAGTIELRLENTLAIAAPISSQNIWLGANARLDASGTAIFEPNEFGLRRGEVFNGGTVRFVANRGAVIANPGSQIDVSGTSTVLDISAPGSAATEAVPTLVATNGGTVDIKAADGILLGGDIDAHAGAGLTTASGGRLNVTLDAAERNMAEIVDERRIVITQDATPVAITIGGALPEAFQRQAHIAVEDIEASGFDSVKLNARTTQGFFSGNELISTGVIEFAGDVNLSMDRSLVLEAARITGIGDVHIDAPYLALGQSDVERQPTPAPIARDAGTLHVSGDFIEVLGHSSIDGFDSVRLNSEGDLRLRGVLLKGQSSIKGSLTTSADLTLRADQIYSSTLSDFSVTLQNNPEGVLRIESTGQARATVLSAASHLTLNAPTIEQAGVLRAPFGTIELNAEEVRLQAGSLTSTSAEGAIIPFGTVQAGDAWVYTPRQSTTLEVGGANAIPEQTVALDGERVAIDAGAVIDVSGGGDLLAYEFEPGPTGKRDVLSALEEPGQFAIVPSLNIQYAPFDQQESATSGLSVGDSVHLAGGVAGLPEGDYVLLPARYALLEGAYLIKAADGYSDLRPGATIGLLDGATVVSGRHIVANTQFADARTGGFEVRSASLVAKQAHYKTSLASEFFAAQAKANDTVAPRLPQDAGVLAITAGSQLDINGSLRANGGKDGRGAAVDISAQNLRISEAAGNDGEVVVSAESLTRLGAESLLLGGRRSSTSEGTAIGVAAQTVTIDAGASLSAPEILIAANDTVRVESDAALTATNKVSSVDTYLVDGDSAVLRLASGAQAEIRRDNEDAIAGTLILEQGAKLTADGGALAMDASLDTRSEATLALAGGSLSLGASLINLGAAPDGASGLTLNDAQLSALNLDELVLVSRSTVDLYGDVALDVKNVALDAAGIRGVAQSEDGSITATQSIVLTNRADREVVDTSGSFGTLALNASEIVVGEGEQTISGYQSVWLNASKGVRGEDEGGLNVTGDLTLVTPAMVAATVAKTTIKAGGALSARSDFTNAGVQGAELGGTFKLTGATVDVATRVEAAAGAVSIASTTGDVTLSSGALIDVAGRERNFDGILVAAPAGNVTLSAATGNVVTRAGSMIDVSATGGGKAGSIKVSAAAGLMSLAGAMSGLARESFDSGQFSADAQSLDNFSALNTTLNTGGFFAERELRQLGAGDLIVGTGDTVRAHDVSLTADQGSVRVDGVIDARGPSGGDVVLSAQTEVNVSGSILASATTATGKGGDVDLRAVTGAALSSGAVIDVSSGSSSGDSGGDVGIRVSREAVLTLTDARNDALVLAGTIRGADKTTVEGFNVYSLPGGVITSALTGTGSAWYTDADQFMDSEAAVLAALGRTDDSNFALLPGIEIQTDGDLSLGTAALPVFWNLLPWRFGATDAAPGVLTLRAGGNLTINGSISDGFTAATGSRTQITSPTSPYRLQAGPSDTWSYRLIAGADRESADVMAVDPLAAHGDFSIAGGTGTGASPFRMIRTGNGSIDVAAAGDFKLDNQYSVLYTAGVASADGVLIGPSLGQGLGNRRYPVNGGDINIDVQGDIQGAQTDQLVTDWLWRVGRPDGYATAWTVNFFQFEQNIGALGGGDVNISAGGDIRNLSASIPTIGRQMRAQSSEDGNVVDVIGGGNLNVHAGGSIAGGSFYVGRGTGSLQAGGDVTTAKFSSDPDVAFEAYPILALGDGQWDVTARGSAGIETVVNPTLLPQGDSLPSSNVEANASFFSTYSDDSAVSIRSVAGDVKLSNNVDGLTGVLTSLTDISDTDNQIMLQIQPPTLRVAALSGDVRLSGQTTLYPASGSTVELLAEGSIVKEADTQSPTVQLRQSDADRAVLPGMAAPHVSTFDLARVLGGINTQEPDQHAPVPVHADDDSVARIVARTGDIHFESLNATDSSLLHFSTPARIVAAGDIIDLALTVQHDDRDDISSIVAGGDFRYTTTRSQEVADLGAILRNSREINVDGPGLLQIAALGDVDLKTSAGISTRGNVVNPNLPDGGASISVMAGATESDASYAAVISRYLELGTGYQDNLVDYVESITGEEDLSEAQAQARFEQFAAYRERLVAYVERRSGRDDLTEDSALELFRGYTRSEQREMLEYVAFSELKFSGAEAAISEIKDYTRGFTALQTLFPGANPDVDAGEANPYSGDISLYFSRIYTLDGGDISLLAPGGEINVGLASPPSAYGLVKGAAELGLVVQRTGTVRSLSYQDFAVNESRVFAADGGDITVWSTDGDIDAGRGSKTAISSPAPTITFDDSGRAIVNFPPALTGSGIQTLATTKGLKAGTVGLFAPRGVVNSGDAGIVAGDLIIAATAVLGADNIQVSGVAAGLPISPDGLGADLAGVAAAASSATNSATTSLDGGRDQDKAASPLSDTALSWLEVFVVGLGEDNCGPSDVACLKRQKLD